MSWVKGFSDSYTAGLSNQTYAEYRDFADPTQPKRELISSIYTLSIYNEAGWQKCDEKVS